MKHCLVCSVLALILIAPAGVVGATWNVADDFSTAQNPAGNWEYGWIAGNAFNSYTFLETAGDGAGNSFTAWHAPGAGNWDNEGNIGKNFGPNPINAWGSYREVGQIIFGPGANGNAPTAKWTAPSDMTINVNAVFSGQGTGGSDSTVYVILGSNVVFQQSVGGFAGTAAASYTDAFGLFGLNPTQTYTSTLSVTAGQTLGFLVSANSSQAPIGLSATITTVPEPMTLGLLTLGLLFVRKKA